MSPASFFSISLYFNILADLSLSSFLPSRWSPPPLLRRESWAGEVSTQEPKLSSSSHSPRRRATVREPQQRGAPGRRLAPHQRKCGWSSRRAARLQGAPANRSSGLQSLQKLAVSGKGRRGSAVPQAAESSHRRCFCPARAEPARRERPTSSPRRLPPARAPALCKILSGTELPAALERQGGIVPSASRSRLDGHHGRGPEATRNQERARAVKEETRPRRLDALSEGAPSGSQGLPASIHPLRPSLPALAER